MSVAKRISTRFFLHLYPLATGFFTTRFAELTLIITTYGLSIQFTTACYSERWAISHVKKSTIVQAIKP